MNNIRAVYCPQGLPASMPGSRLAECGTPSTRPSLCTGQPRSGAFRQSLGRLGDARLFSVEATGQGCSVLPLTTTVTGHANHLVHAALAGVQQMTDSSASRRLRAYVQWRETQPAV
ncbi:hypothetical protein ACLB1E_34005 [Escherichia coli]